MSKSQTIELGPNSQDAIGYPVDEDTESVLVTLKSSEHDDVQTIPSWFIDDEEFPDESQPIDEYPAAMEPLGDRLEIKFRNQVDRETSVTVGIREKKLG